MKAPVSTPNLRIWRRKNEKKEGEQLKTRGLQSFLNPPLSSLSHTSNQMVWVGFLPHDSRFVGIGLDLERSDRILSQRLEKRIVSERELQWKRKSLDLWVIKEACYKANPRSRGTVIPQYEVWDLRSEGSDRVEGRAYYGGNPKLGEFRFRFGSIDGYSCCMALCYQTQEERD